MKWLESALQMVAAIGLAGASGFFGPSELGQTLRGGPPTPFAAPGMHLDFETGKFKHRRRRRRRALTASDRADIAFIAGILGKPAGKDIAAIIAARTG